MKKVLVEVVEANELPAVHFRVIYFADEYQRLWSKAECNYDGLPFEDCETFEDALVQAASDKDAAAIFELDREGNPGRMVSTVAHGGVA